MTLTCMNNPLGMQKVQSRQKLKDRSLDQIFLETALQKYNSHISQTHLRGLENQYPMLAVWTFYLETVKQLTNDSRSSLPAAVQLPGHVLVERKFPVHQGAVHVDL